MANGKLGSYDGLGQAADLAGGGRGRSRDARLAAASAPYSVSKYSRPTRSIPSSRAAATSGQPLCKVLIALLMKIGSSGVTGNSSRAGLVYGQLPVRIVGAARFVLAKFAGSEGSLVTEGTGPPNFWRPGGSAQPIVNPASRRSQKRRCERYMAMRAFQGESRHRSVFCLKDTLVS